MGEDREIVVHLPDSYGRDFDRDYPVLYVLDGSSQSTHTAESAALLARIGVMPEVITVGVANMGSKTRERDYTPPGMRQNLDLADSPEGRGDRFLEFLETELLPQVEARYRTNGHRMLAGNSRSALLVVHSLIARPLLFDARFAHSPALWRDDEAMVGRLDRLLKDSSDLPGFLYLSLGDRKTAR